MTVDILAFDLGNKLGWAVRQGNRKSSGVKVFTPKNHESDGMRMLRFKGFLDDLMRVYEPQYVYYEEVVGLHVSNRAAANYFGFRTTLLVYCEEKGIDFCGVPVGTIKKFATGKGNAKKDKMILAANRLRDSKHEGEITDDNQADAVCIREYALSLEIHSEKPKSIFKFTDILDADL